MEVKLQRFLTSALNASQGSALRFGCFNSGKRARRLGEFRITWWSTK